MDAHHFDRLTLNIARRPTRRTALRLLVGGMLGAWLSQRGLAPVPAQRPDQDGDGLYDDDETNVYGTDPTHPDTDRDGATDGSEIYYRDNGLGDPDDPLVPEAMRTPPPPEPCPAGQNYCRSGCTDLSSDPFNCGGCDLFCDNIVGPICINGTCTADPAAPAPVYCPAGQTDCGGSCVNLSSHAGHCGACFTSCPLGGICQGGVCGGVICMDGLTDCGGTCVDTRSRAAHCGGCFQSCPLGGICGGGVCVAG
jgi:hypothetical protein